MTTERKKGVPGEAPFWEWDWPWHLLWERMTQGGIPVSTAKATELKPPLTSRLIATPWKAPTLPKAPAQRWWTSQIAPSGKPSGWQLRLGEEEIGLRPQPPDVSGLSEKDAGLILDLYDETLKEWNKRKREAAVQRLGLEDLFQQREKMAEHKQIISQLLAAQQTQGRAAEQAQRQAQIDKFEFWRNWQLERLTGPANEVERWFVQHKPNPYRQWGGGGEAEAAGYQALRAAEASGDAGAIKAAETRVAEEAAGLREEEETREAAAATYAAGPPAPGWLRQLGFLPEVEERLSLKKGLGRVETPSGQQLTALLPSQAEYLGGAIDWFGKGKAWRDMLAEAEMMQPYTPAGARAPRRWTPARV